MMKIGDYEISALETGKFALDGGAMFGVIPKALWERTNPADEKNRIDMRLRTMLIQKPGTDGEPAQNILIDCGMGTKWTDKYIDMYQIDHREWSLHSELAKKNLRPEDITHVIQTHLHFDHAGGLTYMDKELMPTFPNANVYVQRRNWEQGMNPNLKDRVSYMRENYELYGDSARCGRKLILLDTPSTDPSGKEIYTSPKFAEEEILPGISVQVSNGHTLGMQTVRVSDGNTHLSYMADLIPTATHVRLPFVMGYDCFPSFIIEEKKQVLNRAADEGGLFFYEHCPRMILSGVGRTSKGDFQAVADDRL